MSDRSLEQQALRNVRGLVDYLERTDALSRKRQLAAVGVILVAVAVVLALVLGRSSARGGVLEPEQQRQRACELEAWNQRSADFERSTRAAHPDWQYRDVQRQLEGQRASFMADAKTECEAKAAVTR